MSDSKFEQLSPDEQLVVKLLLDSGRSQTEIAEFLAINEELVSERAQTAFKKLNEPTESVSRALRRQSPPKESKREPVTKAERREPSDSSDSRELPVSRRGGIVLLAVVAAIIVSLLVIFNGDDDKSTATKSVTTAPTETSSTSSTTPSVLQTVKLTAPNGGRAAGAAQIVKSGKRIGIVLAAQKVKPSGSHDAYAVWLTEGADIPKRLGFAQPVKKNGNLTGIAELPDGYETYGKVVVSRETTQRPTVPGTIVLEGDLG